MRKEEVLVFSEIYKCRRWLPSTVTLVFILFSLSIILLPPPPSPLLHNVEGPLILDPFNKPFLATAPEHDFTEDGYFDFLDQGLVGFNAMSVIDPSFDAPFPFYRRTLDCSADYSSRLLKSYLRSREDLFRLMNPSKLFRRPCSPRYRMLLSMLPKSLLVWAVHRLCHISQKRLSMLVRCILWICTGGQSYRYKVLSRLPKLFRTRAGDLLQRSLRIIRKMLVRMPVKCPQVAVQCRRLVHPWTVIKTSLTASSSAHCSRDSPCAPRADSNFYTGSSGKGQKQLDWSP